MAAQIVDLLKCDPMLTPYVDALDFSPKTLAGLDNFFTDWYGPEVYDWSDPKKYSESQKGIIQRYGIYLAEVLRRAVNGFWMADQKNFFQSKILTPGGKAFFPFVCVLRRLSLGEKAPLTAALTACGYAPDEKAAARVDFIREMAEQKTVPGEQAVDEKRRASAMFAAAVTQQQLEKQAAQNKLRRRRNQAILGAIGIVLACFATYFGVWFFLKFGLLGVLALAYILFR